MAGLEEHNQIARDLARELGCLLVDVEGRSKANPELSDPMFIDRVHMTNKGVRLKVKLLVLEMDAAGWLTAPRSTFVR